MKSCNHNFITDYLTYFYNSVKQGNNSRQVLFSHFTNKLKQLNKETKTPALVAIKTNNDRVNKS